MKWEYHITLNNSLEISQVSYQGELQNNCRKFVGEINALGEDGWELVSADQYVYIFKRIKE